MLENEIKHIQDVLAKDTRILFAYLFGSRAKGMAGERSDWDIAVYTADKAGQPVPAALPFYIEAEIAALPATSDVQVTILNGLESPLLRF